MRHLFALMLIALLAACVSSTPAPVSDRGGAASSGASTAGTYVVRRGDTLYSIAREQGVETQQLMAWNQLSDTRLSTGQVLRTRAPQNSNTVASSSSTAVTTGVIEAKPLGPPPGMSGQPSSLPSVSAAASSAPSSNSGASLKTQPQAVKLPYSEQNLARLQQTESAAPPSAPAIVTPTPKTETPAAKIETPAAEAPKTVSAAATSVTETVSKDGVEWSWPAAGAMVNSFGEEGGKGVEIGGNSGDAVYAAAGGKVTYAGAGVRGYGNLIIIKHNDKYLSAYAHNKNILVKQWQTVKRGQKIAELGTTGTDAPKLHFEIRRMGQPVDPVEYLPPRSN